MGQEDEPLDSAPGERLAFSGQVQYIQILDSALESLLVLRGQIYANSGLCPREPPDCGGQIQYCTYMQILDSAP